MSFYKLGCNTGWIFRGCYYGKESDIKCKIEESDIHVLKVRWPEFAIVTTDNEYCPDVNIVLDIDSVPTAFLESECEAGNTSERDKENRLKRRERNGYDVRNSF